MWAIGCGNGCGVNTATPSGNTSAGPITSCAAPITSMCCRADLSLPYLGLGKPDAGKPPVRFDEGWGADGHWPCASQSVAPCLLYTSSRATPPNDEICAIPPE